jgi:hypothetical protein
MSRQVYEQAIIWASKATERSNFWKKQREASKSDSIRITIMIEKEKELENSPE